MPDALQEYDDQLANDYNEDRWGGSYGQFVHRQEELCFPNWGIPCLDGAVLSLGCGTGRLIACATHGSDISPPDGDGSEAKFPQKNRRGRCMRATHRQREYYLSKGILYVLRRQL